MDVVSGGELARALKAGVSGDRIVFSGVGKSREEMEQALRVPGGIFSFNVESLSELEVLAEVADSLGVRARVALRFNPDVDAKTHPSISTGLKKNKFGMPAPSCLEATKRSLKAPSIQLVGLSCHIGSQIFRLGAFEEAFSKTLSMVHRLQKILGRPLEFVDFGGGIGVRYAGERAIPLARYGSLVKRLLLQNWPGLRGAPRVCFEPGRLLSGNSGILVTRVLYRKKQGAREFLILDAGMNDLMRPALYDAYHEIVPVSAPPRGPRVSMEVVGPVCESTDAFASGRKLPNSLRGGDLVAILSAGAYGASLSNSYNTRRRPAEVLVDGTHVRLIRRRDRFEDLWAAEEDVP